MLLVDPREGSKHLLEPLRKQGLPVQLETLKYADVAFVGRGVGGREVAIGVELKVLSDLCQSLKNRLPADQLPGLVTAYDRAWLLVEGRWRHNELGQVCQQKVGGIWQPVPGAPPAIELEKRLLTLETCGGLHVRNTNSSPDTVRFITALYRFWTDKDLDEHKSHLAIHAPDIDKSLFRKVTQFEITMRTFPGLERGRLGAVMHAFGGDILLAMSAPVDVWASIEVADKNGKTRRIGESTARKIVNAIRGGNNEPH